MRVIVICLCLMLMCSIALASTPKVVIAYDANGQPEYVGKGQPGLAESLTPTGYFQIKKVTYSSGKITDIKWADGNDKYDNSWVNRANLTYE